MCGFVGFSGRCSGKEQLLDDMLSTIIHRGPDDSGIYTDDNIALGFRRLSIIDLSDGAQPMKNEDGSIVIVYNGEIYNFQQLRDELAAKGHTFATRCDTEVLIHGYEEYGTDILGKIRGMFSFVLYDKNKALLFGARDFFGIKPLYYGRFDDGELFFGSEIKSFIPHPSFRRAVNPRVLRAYLTFQYSASEETFFDGVYKLPPAHYFVFQGGKLDIKRFWDISFNSREASFEELRDDIAETVHKSVEAHRISDVPVGSFLSGGVDSSYITAELMPEKTFSVGFAEQKFDETNEAAELSKLLGVENYKKIITPDECFEAFPDIQYHMDEPQSNPSSVPLWFLSKLASEHVTVVLSGEGADEIYAGYEAYDETPAIRKYKKLPAFLRVAAAGIAEHLPYFKGHDFIINSSGRPEDYFFGEARVFLPREADAVLSPEYRQGPTAHEITSGVYRRAAGKTELEKKQYLDLCLWLPGDILLKADKMSMAHSLELRVPYLDKIVMEQAETIPSSFKISGKNTKYIFRCASNKILPNDWANRKKKGFPVPIRAWLREKKYADIVRSYFDSEYAAVFFDKAKLLSLLDEHFEGKINNGRKIWTVFTFLVWYKRFFIDIPENPITHEA